MKSNLIHALLATVLLASCSQEEVIQEVDTSQSAIGFSTFVDKATRAVTTTTGNFSTFKVWGTKFRKGNVDAVRIMDGTVVTKSGSEWTYSPTKYWVNNNAYSFTALGSSNANITNYYTYTTPVVSTIAYDTYLTHYIGTLFYNNSDQAIDYKYDDKNTISVSGANGSADLIWASNKVPTIGEKENGPELVTFSFGHLLSRVRLKFVNSRTIDAPEVALRNVKISSASTGTLDFSQYNVGTPSTDFVWTPSDERSACGFYFPDSVSNYTLAKDNNVLTLDQFLIPSQQNITVSFECNTSITTDGSITISKDINFGEYGDPASFKDLYLKPGYSYTLVAYLTDELDNSGKMRFAVKIDDYIEVTASVYAMEIAKPKTVSTSPNDENKDYSRTISVNKITSVDELVYYGNSSTTTPASAPTRSSDSTPTEINYKNFTYKWSIPKNVNYSFDNAPSSSIDNNVYEKTITPATNYASNVSVDLHVKGNYSPNGKTDTTNKGSIPVTLSMINSEGKVIHSEIVNVEVEYTVTTTGGSQDGSDNDT